MNLPEGWIETTIDQVVADLQSGFAQRPGEESAGTLPQIRTHNISPLGRVTTEGIKHVIPSSDEASKYRLEIGDVLFNNTNSEEWVGKTAVFDKEGEYVFSNHITRLRVDKSLVHPYFLASYLHLLWARGYSKTRAKRWVSQAAIDIPTLKGFRVPLPSIPEQRRIVDLLNQAESLERLKANAGAVADGLTLALFEQMFGVVGTTGRWKYEPFGKHTTYSKYGPRFPDQQYGDKGFHVLRTTDMNRDGTIRWWESPKLELNDVQAAEHSLKPGTLLISRSGTIGPVAVYDGPTNTCVAGAYLIEFGLAETLDNEFARALFLTPHVQRMLQKAVRSVAQPNINAPTIKEISIPIPPITLQGDFAHKATAIRAWQHRAAQSVLQIEALVGAVITEAFTGRVTESWRDLNAGEIEIAAKARDATVSARNFKVLVSTEEKAPPERATLRDGSTRRWVLNELSDFQGFVRTALHEFKGTLLPDDAQALDGFCRLWPIEHELRPHDRVRRVLDQLAELGLIAKITVQNTLGDFVVGYRSLRPEEETRLQDASRLQALLREQSTKAQENSTNGNDADKSAGESKQ